MALTKDRSCRRISDGVTLPGNLGATLHCFRGSILATVPAGTLTDAAAGAGLRFAGISESEVAAGAATTAVVTVRRDHIEWLPNSVGVPITAAMVGRTAYRADDEFVRAFVAGGANDPVGEILAVDAAKGVLVRCDGLQSHADQLQAQTGVDLALRLGGAGGATQLHIQDSTGAVVAAVDSVGGAYVTSLYPADPIGLLPKQDLQILATAGQDIDIVLGDDAGVQELVIRDLQGIEVLHVDSDGNLVAAGTVTPQSVPYGQAASAGVPTQAELVAALGAASNGKWGIFRDTDGAGAQYLCGATTAGGWGYVALTIPA